MWGFNYFSFPGNLSLPTILVICSPKSLRNMINEDTIGYCLASYLEFSILKLLGKLTLI